MNELKFTTVIFVASIFTAIAIAGDYPLVWVNNAQTGKQDRTLNGKTIYADVSSVRGHLSNYSANRASEPKGGPLSNYTYVKRPGFSGYSLNRQKKMTAYSTSRQAEINARVTNSRFSNNSTYTAAHVRSIVPAGGHPAAGSNRQVQYNNGGSFAGAAQLNYSGGFTRVGNTTKTPASMLTVISDLASSAVNYVVRLINNVTTQFAQSVLSFDFNSGTAASINAIQNSSGRNSALTFNNMTGNALREAMRITGDKIGIGTTTPTGIVEITSVNTVPLIVNRPLFSAANPTVAAAQYYNTLQTRGAGIGFNFGTANQAGTLINGALVGAVFGNHSVNKQTADLLFKTANFPLNGSATPTEAMRITSERKVGIGNAAPAQMLHIGTGFKVYSGGRFELPSSAMPEQTIEGLVWKNQHTFYGNQYQVTRSFNMAHGILTSGTTVGNTTTETTVYTAAQAANYPTAGKTIKIKLLGYLSKRAADTMTIRLKVGSTTLLTSTVATTGAPLTNAPLHGDFYFTYRTVGASGTCISSAAVDVNNTSIDASATATTTVDTTASNNITVTFQWSAADAGNTTTVTQGYTETLGALEMKNSWYALHQDPIARREDYV